MMTTTTLINLIRASGSTRIAVDLEQGKLAKHLPVAQGSPPQKLSPPNGPIPHPSHPNPSGMAKAEGGLFSDGAAMKQIVKLPAPPIDNPRPIGKVGHQLARPPASRNDAVPPLSRPNITGSISPKLPDLTNLGLPKDLFAPVLLTSGAPRPPLNPVRVFDVLAARLAPILSMLEATVAPPEQRTATIAPQQGTQPPLPQPVLGSAIAAPQQPAIAQTELQLSASGAPRPFPLANFVATLGQAAQPQGVVVHPVLPTQTTFAPVPFVFDPAQAVPVPPAFAPRGDGGVLTPIPLQPVAGGGPDPAPVPVAQTTNALPQGIAIATARDLTVLLAMSAAMLPGFPNLMTQHSLAQLADQSVQKRLADIAHHLRHLPDPEIRAFWAGLGLPKNSLNLLKRLAEKWTKRLGAMLDPDMIQGLMLLCLSGFARLATFEYFVENAPDQADLGE